MGRAEFKREEKKKKGRRERCDQWLALLGGESKKKEREERLAEERISKITQRTKQGRKTRDVASGEKS